MCCFTKSPQKRHIKHHMHKNGPKGHHIALDKPLKGTFSTQNTRRPIDNHQRSTQSDRQLDTFCSFAVVQSPPTCVFSLFLNAIYVTQAYVVGILSLKYAAFSAFYKQVYYILRNTSPLFISHDFVYQFTVKPRVLPVSLSVHQSFPYIRRL